MSIHGVRTAFSKLTHDDLTPIAVAGMLGMALTGVGILTVPTA